MNTMPPRIWLTRPAAQADATTRAFTGCGFEVIAVPVLSISPLQDETELALIRTRIADFDRYHFVLFVSQNAVDLGAPWLDQYWPQLPEQPQFLAVGSATEQALHSAGLPVVGTLAVSSAMNSESLLALPQLQQLEHKKVLIFRGQGGRTLLAERLRERGAQVDYCELYQRQLPTSAQQRVAAAMAAGPAWLSVHSGESLQNLVTLLRATETDDWLHWPLLVPGSRVAQIAQDLGFSDIVVAANATDVSMAQALQQRM